MAVFQSDAVAKPLWELQTRKDCKEIKNPQKDRSHALGEIMCSSTLLKAQT